MSALLDELRETEVKRMDYVGFTFDGIHSSQLKILSVSDGSRYSKDLLPTIEDYSIDIVGGYGSNYFGGTFKKRDIVLNIAFDQVREEELMAIREWLGDREVHELFFDENPYKVYHAVVSRTPTIKYIAFGDVGTRIYKGEGSIVFTCYDPIAKSLNGNYLEDYEWENIDEWAIASGMLDSKDKYENGSLVKNYYDTPQSDGTIYAYNAGILPTPFKMYITWQGTQLNIQNLTTGKSLVMKRTSTNEEYILVDTERSVALEMSGISKSTLPQGSSNELGKVYKYTGSNGNYITNKYYICEKEEQYVWNPINQITIIPSLDEIVFFPTEEDKNDYLISDAHEGDYCYFGNAYYKCVPDEVTSDLTWQLTDIVIELCQSGGAYIQTVEGQDQPFSPSDGKIYHFTGTDSNNNYSANTYYISTNGVLQETKIVSEISDMSKINCHLSDVICHYNGTTVDNYVNDKYYKMSNDGNVSWQELSCENASEMPTPQKTLLNELYVYSGNSGNGYTQNYIYECVRTDDIYVWHLTNQPDLSETKVVLNNLVETGRFFTLQKGLNKLKVTGGEVTKFEFYHRYL